MQIGQQLVDVLLLPLVLALVLVDREGLALQQLLHAPVVRRDRAHTRRILPVSSSCIIPCLRRRVLSRRVLERGDLGVHVGEDGGDGGLFGEVGGPRICKAQLRCRFTGEVVPFELLAP